MLALSVLRGHRHRDPDLIALSITRCASRSCVSASRNSTCSSRALTVPFLDTLKTLSGEAGAISWGEGETMTSELDANPRHPVDHLAVDADGTVTLRAANCGLAHQLSKGPGYRLLVSHAKRVPAWI